jgi:hypothetical protein
VVTIGIDPHKRTLTAAALDPHSRLLGQQRLAATSQAGEQLLAWAEQWPERRWAVEGASGLGRGIAQRLVTAGEPVLDVPAKLAARASAARDQQRSQDRPGRRRLGGGRRHPPPAVAPGRPRGPHGELPAAV